LPCGGDRLRGEVLVRADVVGAEAGIDPGSVARRDEVPARERVLDPGGTDVGEVRDQGESGLVVVQVGRGEVQVGL
jgi:hypothetical protein